MVRPLAVLVLLAVMLSRAALGDYQAGLRAWGRGEFAAAAAAFLPAAQAGEAESQYMMGRLYALGDGVPRDFVQAWLWFDRAARQGHAPAAEARDGLGHVLNGRQLALARQLARPPAPVSEPAPPVETLPQDGGARPVLLVPRHGVVRTAPAGVADQQQAAR